MNREKKRRIGIFGGAFDPIHDGHVGLALAAKHKCDLQFVLFVPTARGPHKKHHASFSDRVAMLEAVLGKRSDLRVSLIEGERKEPSYTVDTLEELGRRMPQADFYFLLGSDSLLDLPSWYKYRRLLTMTNFIVAPRQGIELSAVKRSIRKLPGDYSQLSQMLWQSNSGKTISYLDTELAEISSSAIREQIAVGSASGKYLHPLVQRYIEQHNLYKR